MIAYGVAEFSLQFISNLLFFIAVVFEKKEPISSIALKYGTISLLSTFFFIFSSNNFKIIMPEIIFFVGLFTHLFFWAYTPFLLLWHKISYFLIKETWLKKIFLILLLFQAVIYQFALTIFLKLLFLSINLTSLNSVVYGFFKILMTLFLWGICYCNFVLNEEMPGLMSWIVIIVLAGATYFFVSQEWIVVMGKVVAK